MKVIMYCPWPNRSFVDHALEYIAGASNRQHKKEKQYYVREHGPKVLNDLQPTDRLYILGHGVDSGGCIQADTDTPWNPNYAALGYSAYNGPKVKTTILKPAELVTKLTQAGLPQEVTDIRLWVCKGGDKSFDDFGWTFTALLLKINKGAIVTAYKGFMLLPRKTGKKTGQLSMEGESSAAKNFRMVVNNDEFFRLYRDDD